MGVSEALIFGPGKVGKRVLLYTLYLYLSLFPSVVLSQRAHRPRRLPVDLDPFSPGEPLAGPDAPDPRAAAIQRLSRVFRLDKVPVLRHHRSPPQYMLDLYRNVADTDGITKNRSPYGSNVVRGFPDRDSEHQMHFHFNVSYIGRFEQILQAEFHLFKLKPRLQESSRPLRGVHLIELRLYQVLDLRNMYSPGGAKLLEVRRVSAHRHGWEVFRVKDTVQEWVNYTNTNQGLLVTATSLGGSHVNGTYFRFAQRAQHHDSKQPVLIAFTEEDAESIYSTITTDTDPPSETEEDTRGDSDEDEDDVISAGPRTTTRWSSIQQEYLLNMNENHRKRSGKTLSALRSQLHTNTRRRQEPEAPNRKLRSKRSVSARGLEELRSTTRKRQERSVDYYNAAAPKRRKHTCSRHELYVDFDEIGWSGWIISPRGYNAYHCKGECPFPLGQNQRPTNHATVQSIVNALRIGKGVGTPCCVPNKLYSISLLYFDDDENVILKQYDDMVAASCGCH